MFHVDSKECIFFQENQITSLSDDYAYVTDGNIDQFLNQIPTQNHISTLLICQDFFYQKIVDWCAFQDQLASLFTQLPNFKQLHDLYLKLEIFTNDPSEEFKPIDLSTIRGSENIAIRRQKSQENSRNRKVLGDQEFNNILDMLSFVIESDDELTSNLRIHLNISLGSHNSTMHFIDSLSKIQNLISLDLKYYQDEQLTAAEEGIPERDNQLQSRNRLLLPNLTRQITKCLKLNSLKLTIQNVKGLSPIQMNDNGHQQNQFNQEIMQFTSALSQCKSLQKVSLNLPLSFFFQDYLKQKSITEQSILQNFRMLSNAKQIKVFEFHLIKFQKAPNLRRRTVQINNLLKFLKKGIIQNLSHLVHYQA